ncbi:MAG TPA: hypothetical protein VNZ64_09085 [Candidatus Acidoferrum sp.]|jgi:hypothetical protein|nr:hypothetical protein [Candidatus Acidoferrum sp.]
MVRGRVAFWLLGACIGAGLMPAAFARPDAAPSASGLAAEEKDACIANLKQIYDAIQAYQVDHKDLPNWLSDLVPQYLSDANVLVCPVCRRTGKTEGPPLADPKLPSSYLFEFCPVPLGNAAPNRTRRDWKRRQMGLVGAVVPIVRCRHHDPVLNLAFDGKVYESPSTWELVFTNRISAAELTAARVFADDSSPRSKPPENPPAVRQLAQRDPQARPQLLDLTAFYNAMLTETWHARGGAAANDLATLPTGLQTFAGIEFDVRGIIQLKSKSDSLAKYPGEIKGIPVGQKCQHLYFLHSAGVGKVADEGKQIGAYVIHYATSQMRLEVPIVYGQAVRDWHTQAGEPPPSPELQVAWRGQNETSKRAGNSIRLFLTTWTNLVPNVEIESLDFVSSMANPAPFLIAITAD